MREHIRSNVVGYLALFCFAMAGTAQALPDTDTVDSGDIINFEVKRQDLDTNAVNSFKVAPDALTGADIGPAAVGFTELDPTAFAAGDISPQGSPSGFGVSPDAIQSGEIGDATITGADVADATLTGAEIASNSLTDAEIDEDALGLTSTYAERTAGLTLTTSYVKVLETDLVFDAPAQLLAMASLELDGDGGNDGDDHAVCYIEIDGAISPLYGHTVPDTLYDRATIAIVFARVFSPGVRTTTLWCRRDVDPALLIRDAGMTVTAIPRAP